MDRLNRMCDRLEKMLIWLIMMNIGLVLLAVLKSYPIGGSIAALFWAVSVVMWAIYFIQWLLLFIRGKNE